jgi:periplasmic copper chaperone A
VSVMRFDFSQRSLAICALLLALVQPAFADNSSIAGTPTVRVIDAWIRWLPAGVPAGGYATLSNMGEKPAVLIAAISPYFGEISMHRSREQGGSITMAPVERIIIDPHSSLNFAAAGYHLMMMRPTRSIKPGERVPVMLRFADGFTLTIAFDVKALDGNGT